MSARQITDTEKAFAQFLSLLLYGKYQKSVGRKVRTVEEIATDKGYRELLAVPAELVQDMIDNQEQWEETYPFAVVNSKIMEMGYEPFKT